MSEPNWKNRTLWTGRDNLEVMRGMNSESVDLIYLDPPFNRKKHYAAPIGSKAAGAVFKDSWTFDDVDRVWLALTRKENPPLHAVIQSGLLAHSTGMAAYLGMMAQRLQEMRRILKPDGTIYLHCDPTASHYLKTVLDVIFGMKNCRNEIIWCYAGGGIPKKDFPRKHDTILRYTSSDDYFYQPIYRPYSPGTVQRGRTAIKGKYYEAGLREEGTPTNDWWTDVPKITSPDDPEKTGYPTQKSLALLRRIITASSNNGDTVFDPFCGCATTCVAAEHLSRQWVGIDISHKAAELVRFRLQQAATDRAGGPLFTAGKKVVHRTDQPQRTDLGKLPRYTVHKNTLYGENEFCGGCGEHFLKRNLTVDHIVPTSKGGTDHPGNLWLLCGACNSSKSNKSQAEFLRDRMSLQGADVPWLEAE